MKLIRNIISTYKNKRKPTKNVKEEILLGRYSIDFDTLSKIKLWEKVQHHFIKKQYILFYEALLIYLQHDMNNCTYRIEKGVVHFYFYQGSQKIKGQADAFNIAIEAYIFKLDTNQTDMISFFLRENFMLRYAKYGYNSYENYVTLSFTSSVDDLNPYLLLEAMKEVALTADRIDDSLAIHYKNKYSATYNQNPQIDFVERSSKVTFIKEQTDNCIHKLASLQSLHEHYLGSQAFLLLDTLYTIDFVTRPQGRIKDFIDLGHSLYFNTPLLSLEDKITQLKQILTNINKTNEEDYYKEFYKTKYTFGQTYFEFKGEIDDILSNQLPEIDWFIKKGKDDIALSVAGFITGYVLYSYTLPEHIRQFLILIYRIRFNGIFTTLGYPPLYTQHGKINAKKIKTELVAIIDNSPNLNKMYAMPIIKKLNLSSISHCIYQILIIITEVNKVNR